MDFIMRGWGKNSRKLCCGIVLILFCSKPSVAGEFSARIKQADLTPQDGWYVLNAEFEHLLSPVAKEAVQSSIPLIWCLQIRLKQQGYFFNRTVLSLDYRYSIRYHALLNNYSVMNNDSQMEKKYTSLAQSLEALARIHDLKIIPLSALPAQQRYQMQIKLQFDKEQLPPPLRPMAYLNSEWNLSSGWYVWAVQNN
jgi:hypothetical protein